MEHPEKTYQLLETLDSKEISTQRQLSEYSGISLGQVNYLLKSLLEKGLVKIGNFRKNPKKIGYVYLLTPKGIETKSKLAVSFVMSKLKEYNSLRTKLAERLAGIEEKGHTRIIFVGPAMVNEFVVSIIEELDMKLIFVKHCSNWEELKETEIESFDIALLFDGNSKGVKKIADSLGIPHKKLLTLL